MLEEKFKDTMAQVSKETIDRHFALSIERKDEFFEQLVQMGADVNINHGQALAMAVQDNDLERMKLLLEHGADLTLLNGYALKLAAATENLEALKLMYKYKQNMKGDEKEVDYEEVATWCDKEIFYMGFNAVVIRTNNLEIVQYLLPEINCQPYRNLCCALKTKNLEIIKLVFASQKIDTSLMREALFSNSREIIEFMMSHCNGKFPEYTINTDGAITMCNLAAGGCCETLKYLIKMSDDARGVYGGDWKFELEYALKKAIECRQVEAIKLLSQYAVIEEIDASEMFKEKKDIKQDDVYSVVKVLIDCKIIKDYERIAWEAARKGRTDILELLQSCGISYDYEGALRAAIIWKHQNTVEYLLKKEELILTREKVEELLTDVRREYEGGYEVIKMLIMKEEESSKKVTS